MDDPSTISYILAAQMRMGIFYWVTVLWRLFPENAAGFFATNCLLISAALALTYGSCFLITRKQNVSLFAALAALASPSVFEVIYTLDKQEVYFPFLFSAVIFLHLVISKCPKSFVPFVAVIASVLASAGYLSKETGIILCVVSACFFATNLIWSSGPRAETTFRFGVLLIAVAAPLIYFKYFLFPVIVDKYVVVTFDAHRLFSKAWQYTLVVPDFFYLLTCTALGALVFSKNSQVCKQTGAWCAFITLTLSSLAATAALISFDTFAGVLVYIWLPIYFMLLPATAFLVCQLPVALGKNGKIVLRTIVGFYAFLLITQIPTRFLQAQYQFSFDSMTTELAHKLADMAQSSKYPTVGAMPTYSVGETEIPEQIETLVRSILAPRYYETKSEKIDDQKFTMLNYLSPICTNTHESGDPPDTFRLSEFRGKSLTYKNRCRDGYVGWTGFQILNGATPFQEWIKRPFGKDNLLIVPYGEATPDAILYRGAATFAHPWQAKILSFPQLALQDIGHVERKLTYIGHHRQTIGWRILKVTNAEPVSFTTSSDGWLSPDSEIFAETIDGKPILQLVSKQQTAQAYVALEDHSLKNLKLPSQQGNEFKLDIGVPERTGIQIFKLRPLPLGSAQRFHIDQAKYVRKESSKEQVMPFIPTTRDGWILQNGVILYSNEQSGKKLIVVTNKTSAPLRITDDESTKPISVENGVLTVPLMKGRPVCNGIYYLQLSSSAPLTSNEEKRELLFQCASQSVK